MRIVALCGSLQRESGNLRLLQLAAEISGPDSEVVLFDGLGNLPLFNPDRENRDAGEFLPAVESWRKVLRECDGVLIASPEYGHSLSGVIKNAIDWVIGTGELYRKGVAITAAVPSPERGLLGLAALRQTLDAVGATVVGGLPIVRGPQAGTELRDLLSDLMAHIAGQSTTHIQGEKWIEATFGTQGTCLAGDAVK